MVKLVAMREFWYAGKTRRDGDEFEATDIDAKILTAPDLGPQKARHLHTAATPTPPAAEQPKKRTLNTTAIKAEENAEPTAPYSRRRYMRRDMTPEE